MPSPPYRVPAPDDGDAPSSQDEPDRLGAVRSVHAPRVRHRAEIVAMGIAAIGLIALIAWSFGLPESAPVVFPVACLGLFALYLLRPQPRVITMHEGGVTVTTKGHRGVAIFEDVDQVFYEMSVSDSSIIGRVAQVTAVRLVGIDGAALTIPLQGVDGAEIVDRIDRACTQPLAHDAETAVAAGEELTFEHVRFDRTSIHVGTASAQWADVKLLRIQVDQVALFTSQTIVPWKTVSFEQIPHPRLFVRLIRGLAPKVEEDTGLRFG